LQLRRLSWYRPDLHGHVLRVLVARWIGSLAGAGQHFLLDTGTLCVLSYYRDVPAVRIWNGPLVG